MTDVGGGSRSSAFSLVRFEREIFPFLQSTQWIPGSDADERDRLAGAYDVVFPYGLLEKIRRDAKRLPEGDLVGLFYGTGCECPWTRRLWIRVDSVVVEEPLRRKGLLRRRRKTADPREVEERIQALVGHDESPEGFILGWFRTRQTDALVLFASESDMHDRSFGEPWQFSVLLPAPGTNGSYGVFGRDEDGEMRDSQARPFYERESDRRQFRSKGVSPPNYRIVERASQLPGRTGAWREVQRRKAPAAATAACMVFGVAGGLALSYELSRASQPGGALSGEVATFASPEPEVVVPTAEERIEGYVDTFKSNVNRATELLERPSSASSYCDDLTSAYRGVHASFVNLVRKRDELEPESAMQEVELAIQAKGRVDARFDRSGCSG
ncbi:MAG: hypothetical protein ACC682_14990 [Gemmatimonadota bacterium]